MKGAQKAILQNDYTNDTSSPARDVTCNQSVQRRHQHTADPESDANSPTSLTSPVPGKYSPNLWKDTVMTRFVV